MDNTKNRCLTALAYKLVDHFPNVTLFGGFVRDVIVRAYAKETFPFRQDYEFECDIKDLDLILTQDNESKHEDLVEYVGTTLTYQLTEWDWRLLNVSDLNEYEHVIGVRIKIKHFLTDVESHLDIIKKKVIHYKDVDVNQFKFNKEHGLFYSHIPKNQSIYKWFERDRHIKRMIEMVKRKECNMLGKMVGPKAHKRCVKMIKKGWTILNLNPTILIHRNEPLEQCQICHEPKEGETTWVELTCSRCTLCLDCFETLMYRAKEEKHLTFSCPTCRKRIEPW